MRRVEDVLALNPDFAEARLAKGKILEQLHRYPDALREYETAQKLFGGASFVDAYRAHATAMAARESEALKLIHDIGSQPFTKRSTGTDIAIAYCGLGRTSDAMKWLNQAYALHQRGLDMIGVDPLFGSCRSDPEFIELLKRLRLAPNGKG